jgi:hypothetical protein
MIFAVESAPFQDKDEVTSSPIPTPALPSAPPVTSEKAISTPPTSPEVNTNTLKARKIDLFASLLNLTNGCANPNTKTGHTATVVKTVTGVKPPTD